MAKIDHYSAGSFCWAELATADIDAAKKFYGEMFGWTATDMPTPNGPYVILRSDGNDAGAICATQHGAPPHWGAYFAVASADDAAAKIAELGGTLLAGPFDAMDAGRMAIGQDPQGAIFSVWQANQHIGATHGGPINAIGWPELATSDVAGAVKFYSALFGWIAKPDTGVESAQYVEWMNNGVSMGGLMAMKGDQWQGVPPHWGVYITVADCDERAAKATALGARICVPPTDIPNVGRFAVVSDLQGAVFSLIQLTHMQLPVGA